MHVKAIEKTLCYRKEKKIGIEKTKYKRKDKKPEEIGSSDTRIPEAKTRDERSCHSLLNVAVDLITNSLR